MDKPLNVASRLLKKMAVYGSTEEERKELTTLLLKVPKLFPYQMNERIS